MFSQKKKILEKFAEFFIVVEERIQLYEQTVESKTGSLIQKLSDLKAKYSCSKPFFSNLVIYSKIKQKDPRSQSRVPREEVLVQAGKLESKIQLLQESLQRRIDQLQAKVKSFESLQQLSDLKMVQNYRRTIEMQKEEIQSQNRTIENLRQSKKLLKNNYRDLLEQSSLKQYSKHQAVQNICEKSPSLDQRGKKVFGEVVREVLEKERKDAQRVISDLEQLRHVHFRSLILMKSIVGKRRCREQNEHRVRAQLEAQVADLKNKLLQQEKFIMVQNTNSSANDRE